MLKKMMQNQFLTRSWPYIALIAIIIIGGYMRFSRANVQQYDRKFPIMAIEHMIFNDTLDPNRYGWPNHTSDYLYLASIEATSRIMYKLPAKATYKAHASTYWNNIHLLHKLISTLELIVIFYIGKRVHIAIGIIAALFTTFLPVLILHAAMLRPDTIFNFIWSLSILSLLQYHANKSTKTLILSCICIALATATKYPGATLLAPLALLIYENSWQRIIKSSCIALAAFLISFFSFAPYLLIKRKIVISDFIKQLYHPHNRESLGYFGNMQGYLEAYVHHSGYIAFFFTILGVIVCIKKYERKAIPYASCLFLLASISIVYSIFDRWGLPIYTGLLMFCAVGIYECSEFIIKKSYNTIGIIMLIVPTCLIILHLVQT